MDKIRNYVDAMFSSLPNRKDVAEMKQSILENMQERYNELLAQGKNENEALGIVISQFGNIDEIKRELGLNGETPQAAGSPTESNAILYVLAFFFPPVFFYLIVKYRDWVALAAVFLSVFFYLSLGFSFHLWHPGWIIFPVVYFGIIIRRMRLDSGV